MSEIEWHRVTECLPFINHRGKKRNDANKVFRAESGCGMGWHTDSSREVLVWSDYEKDYKKTSLNIGHGSCGDKDHYTPGWWGLQLGEGDQWMEVPEKGTGYPPPLPPNEQDLERYRKSREQQVEMLNRWAEAATKYVVQEFIKQKEEM